jgi:huntingtin
MVECLDKTAFLTMVVGVGPRHVTTACEMVAEMVESLQSVLALGHKRNKSMPTFLTAVLKNIVVSLARLPLVNSYTRVPPLVSCHCRRLR